MRTDKVLTYQYLRDTVVNGQGSPIATTGNTYCINRGEVESSKYYTKATPTNAGLFITGYNVGDEKTSYDPGQLILEKDIAWATISVVINAEVTQSVDAMCDWDEYHDEYKLGTERDNIEVSATTTYTYKDYDGTTKTSTITRRIYEKSSSNPDGYTLGGTLVGFSDNDSTSESSYTLSIAYEGATNSPLNFNITQEAEEYGYYPLSTYETEGKIWTTDADDDTTGNHVIGNVVADQNTFNAATNESVNRTSEGEYSSFSNSQSYYANWLDNYGDNYKDTTGGNDAYNSGDTTVVSGARQARTSYDRGIKASASPVSTDGYFGGDSTTHMAWADGVDKTQHWMIDESNRANYSDTYYVFDVDYCCSNDYRDYEYNAFNSEYSTYSVSYSRSYFKEMHVYGKTSILRRFKRRKKTGQENLDTSSQGFTGKYSSNMTNVRYPKHMRSARTTVSFTNMWSDIAGLSINGGNGTKRYTDACVTMYEQPTNGYDNQSSRSALYAVGYNDLYVSCPENTNEDVAYSNIRPVFHFLAPERCTGTPSDIKYQVNGTQASDAYHQTYCGRTAYDYFVRYDYTPYGSYQEAKHPYISYYDDTRSGSYLINGSCNCTPVAPLDDFGYFDTYGDEGDGSDSTAVIRHEAILMQSEYESNPRITSSTTRWFGTSYYDSNISLYDVNNTTFRGYGNYTENGSFYSGKGRDESLKYPANTAYESTMASGASLDTSVTSPSHIVILKDGTAFGIKNYYAIRDGGDGSSYRYSSYSGDSSYNYPALYSNYDISKHGANVSDYTGTFLTPCKASVTCPYWTAKIRYKCENVTGSGHTLVLSVTGNSSGTFAVATNSTSIDTTQPGVYARLVSGTAEGYIEVIVVDYYGTPYIELQHKYNGSTVHTLGWQIDTRSSYSLGNYKLHTIRVTNGWSAYTGNDATYTIGSGKVTDSLYQEGHHETFANLYSYSAGGQSIATDANTSHTAY